MNTEITSPDEEKDFQLRQELQTKLQEAIRRSAPSSELRNIQSQIEKLNRKLEEYASRVKKVGV